MQFVLHYRGPLRAHGSPKHKHELRKAFHTQLKTLWHQSPLDGEHELWTIPSDPKKHIGLSRPFRGFNFVPLVAAEFKCVAELTVEVLRPEPPGNLITQGGDIDNRLKTLFDALTIPRHDNALPKDYTTPDEGETPFFCLLEDDNLISAISVRNEQMLEPVDSEIVDVRIGVKTQLLQILLFGNTSFV